MSYTTYLFDFDYTLADSSRGIVTCFRNVLAQHGYTDVTDEAIKRTIGKTLEESFSILTGVTDADQLEGFRNEYRKEADTHMTINTVLFLETKSVLLALKDAGAFIGIISTKYRFRIKELLDQHFPSNFFNIIVGGEDVKAAKPSPEGLLFAIKQLHATKAETLYIGDSTVDAATAKAAGVDFAGVTHGVTTAEELSKYPHWKIMSSLEELLEDDERPANDKQPTDNQHPAVDKAVSPHPATGSSTVSTPSAPRRKKIINIWQILTLAILLWLSFEEGEDSNVFMWAFILVLWYILTIRRILPNRVLDFISPWWTPCKIRLRALHIKMIHGKQVPVASEESSTCLNCGTTYTGSYCNRCGQSRNTPRYRLSNAFRNILGGFTNIDNGFGRTLLDLLYRPGYMIKDFIAGKRILYFRPFQTLFVLAALYIMTVQLVDPDALSQKDKDSPEVQRQEIIDTREQLQKRIEQTEDPKTKEVLTLTIEKLNRKLEDLEPEETTEIQKKKYIATLEQLQKQKKKAKDPAQKEVLVQTIESIEQSLKKLEAEDALETFNYTIKVRDEGDEDLIDEIVESSLSVSNKLEKFIQNTPFLQKVWNLLHSWGHGNKAFRIIATLPLFALATLMAFRRKKNKIRYNLTEHVFVQAYIACQILLLSIIVLPFNGNAAVDDLYELPIFFIFALFCLDYKQLYGYTWWRSFWTTILMFFYSLILLILFAIIVVGLVVAMVHILNLLL
ncbi:HAD-IA family hydrolase [uncultured Bacteroides sp.]|uniref:HAD-IA family hydrolase n=1 Tax=uncultured Bacteroides sp. TaxID=162156 RepID=UPI0025CD8031|nr:HAD-IA family hydrolase [uncultured Bacteroides sp.]